MKLMNFLIKYYLLIYLRFEISYCNIYVFNFKENNYESISNLTLKFKKEYSYCRQNYCFGIPFVTNDNHSEILYISYLYNESLSSLASQAICSKMEFDNFFSILFQSKYFI